jgi:hypothetical protein
MKLRQALLQRSWLAQLRQPFYSGTHAPVAAGAVSPMCAS